MTTNSVVSSNSDGLPLDIHVSNAAGTLTGDYAYSYAGSGANVGELLSIVQSTVTGGVASACRTLTYTYYDGTNSDGSAGDIRSATITDASGNVVQSEYYRY